jgi:hypothetical protein
VKETPLATPVRIHASDGMFLTGCGKTLRNCHSERSPVPYGAGRSEESGPVHFQEDTQSEILRCAQDDTRGEFFRSLLKSESG